MLRRLKENEMTTEQIVSVAIVCLVAVGAFLMLWVRDEIHKINRNLEYATERYRNKADQISLEWTRNMAAENQVKLDALLEHLDLKTEPVNMKLKVVKK